MPKKADPQSIAKDEEDDPWARFKQMTEQVSNVVKSTTDQLRNLSENSAASEIKEEKYISYTGGTEHFELSDANRHILEQQAEEKAQRKAEKKKKGFMANVGNVGVPKKEKRKEVNLKSKIRSLNGVLLGQRRELRSTQGGGDREGGSRVGQEDGFVKG